VGHARQVPVFELMYWLAAHPQIPPELVNVVAHVVHAVRLEQAEQLVAQS